MYFIFPPHLTSASALPEETRNSEIASFHLNVVCFSPKNMKQLKISPRQPNPLTVKTIDWVHQTGPRKAA